MKTVVIGAGPGGLAAAMLLSQRGIDVEVFEKEAAIGGRNAELILGDYRFDLGPTFLMMKFLLDELFEETGRKVSDYLDCRLLDPMYRLTFADKTMLSHTRPDAMRAEIERVFPGEGVGFDRFLERESRRFERLYPCMQKPYESALSMFSTTLLSALPHIAPGRSLHGVLSSYFRSEELRLAFTFQSKYLGMSPWDCPGLFTMIPYTEHAHGIYHVQGGLCRISQAMGAIAQENGAQIHTSCPVRRVLTKGRRTVGVELESGDKIECDDVVINADFGHAMATLFDEGQLRRYTPGAVRKLRWSCSTFMMYLGLDRTYPDAEHHMIVFAGDYKRNLEDITRRKVTSQDISIYVRNSVVTDPGTAPPGHSALYILVPVPNNSSGINWSEEKHRYRERVLSTLAERTPYKDVETHIQQEMMITPDDWEKRSIYQGATFNMGHNWSQMLFMRPHNKFEEFDHCYLVGGGTHPGSGLPTIFESARISSNLLCQQYRIPYTEPKPFVALGLESA